MPKIIYNTGGSIAVGIDVKKVGISRLLGFVDAADIKVPAEQFIRVGSAVLYVDDDVQLTWTDLDTGSEQSGKNYFVYACIPASGDTPVFKISLNSSYPQGYDANNSRKIGGFHNNPDGDILQYSLWDLCFKPACPNPCGMVYDPGSNVWVDIYLAADDGAGGIKSENGATILDTIDWYSFVDRGKKVGKRLTRYDEFMSYAAGSPEEENIQGSADPVTTGGHQTTGSNRMKSTIGVEDCAGAMYQWGLGNSYRLDGADLAACQAWAWYDLPGAKGSAYHQGTYGIIQPRFGGSWSDGTSCGSRYINLLGYPWNASSSVGARFACGCVNL